MTSAIGISIAIAIACHFDRCFQKSQKEEKIKIVTNNAIDTADGRLFFLPDTFDGWMND